jgi:hypothetical protein
VLLWNTGNPRCRTARHEVHKSQTSYSTRDQTVRFACVTKLRAEGKQTHVLYKAKTLETQDRQRATERCPCEILFRVRVVHAFLSAAIPTSLAPMSFASTGRRTHRFVPTTVPNEIAFRLQS